MRALRLAGSVVGWGLLGTLALVGVTLSAAMLYASSPGGRRWVASSVIRIADAQVAGRLGLGEVDLRPDGAIVISDFEAYDPEGQLVLQVDRLVVAADVTRLRNKVIGLTLELEGATVLMNEDREGEISLLRAFAPAHPSPPSPREPKGPFWRDPLGGWSIRVRKLALRDASVWWQDAAGETRLEVQELSLDARGGLGPRRGRMAIALRGQALAPVPGAMRLEIRVLLDGDRLRVPVLRAQLGETALEGLGDVELVRRTGRAALTRAKLVRDEARDLVAAAPPGADLALDAYAEADGRVATAALHLAPAGAGADGGGEAALAARVDGTPALGFHVVTRALDPSKFHAVAPAGSVSLTARGGFSGQSFARARGNLELDLARSRLRTGELGPAQAAVRLDQGSWEVSRLSLSAPGVRVEGSGAFKQGGSPAARFVAEVLDLARAGDNAGKLLGEKLPRLSGQAKIEGRLSGTAAAPDLTAEVASRRLVFGAASVAGLEAHVEGSGPFRPGRARVRVQARARSYSSGGQVVAHGLALEGALVPAPGEQGAAAATLSASGVVPSLGKEPVSVAAEGILPGERKTLRLSALSLAYPGTRYALEKPATVTFEGPRVDRLALVSGPRRIAVEGGIGRRKALDARIEIVRLDLAKLPAGLLPAEQRIAGELSADVTAAGTLARPRVEGRLGVENGGFRTEQGLGIKGTLRYDGAGRRAALQAGIVRGRGGTLDVEADLPVPPRGRSSEPVSATVRAEAIPIAALLELTGSKAPVAGRAGVALRLSGTVGSPVLHAELSVAEGTVADLQDVGVGVVADVSSAAEATADLKIASRPALHVRVGAPLSLSAILASPGPAFQRLQTARITAEAVVQDLDLASVSGRLGVPAGLRGRLSGEVRAAGRPDAPRGTVALAIADAAYRGYAGIAGTIDAEARDDRVEARIAGRLQGQELLQLTAELRAPVEKLRTRAGLEAAPLRVDGTVPALDLSRAATPSGVPVTGVVALQLHAEGTLSRPVLRVEGSGRSIHVQGRPVGEVRLAARAGGDRASAELALDPTSGGKLTATAVLTVPVSIALDAKTVRAARTEVRFRAEALDLGFLPALAPSVIRSASGKLEADLAASGPLANLVPRGTVRLAGGRLGSLEWGDWSGLTLDGALSEDAIEIRTFEARRGEGLLQLRAALRGLTTPAAQLDGRLEAKQLTVSQAGTDLATVTFGVKASGTYRDRRLDARLDIPEALVQLADKLPRGLQSLERRKDIIIGPKPPPRKQASEVQEQGGKPLIVAVRVVAPGKFNVQRDSPRIRIELKADVSYERQAGRDFMSGSVDVVRGSVEPLSDRRFDVKRGRLTFTGGPPSAALIDAEALYDNPAAKVTVTVTGKVTQPAISLRSQPPMEESQIAMLIATGQTDVKAGGGGAAGAAQNEASQSAAQKAGFAVFNTFIRDQLPFGGGDVSLDASAAKVSGYIPGTKVYVGFTRRFDANRQLGENAEEVRLEYAITPHWTLEGRWGTQNTGGASLIWSKDY